MRALTVTLCLGCALAGAAQAQPKIHPDELKLKPQIDAAIDAGIEALVDRQLRDGTWGRYNQYDGGKTALCAYALLKCGVSVDHPAVRRALLYLDGVKPYQTYTVTCMMLAYSAAGPQNTARVKDLARLLLKWQLEGDYGYPMSRPDLSNTQYAALGLWIAQKHKIRIPETVFLSLITATMQYRSKPEMIKAITTGKHTVTGGGKREVRGFGYTRGKKPTGSMTAAGVSILQICKLGLGGKLGKIRRDVDNAIESGVAWLGHHFRINSNPGAGGSWLYYYLYGMERVGSLTRIEQIGKHWWFVKGAQSLISQQGGDGLWKPQDSHPEVETAFALLFLRRATSIAAATTGSGGSASVKRHLFSAGVAFDPVTIGGAGQQPLSLWIPGFGEDLKERHRQYGIRVVQVEYLTEERILGQIAGNPTKAWKNDTFLYRVPALQRGVHTIHARVTVVAPNVRTGQTTPTEKAESPDMEVEIRDVFAKWMEVAAKLSTSDNLLRGAGVRVTATSNPKNAKFVTDGNDATHWVCTSKDENPEITLMMPKPVSASKLVFSQAGGRGVDRGQFDHILDVEVFINKDVKPTMITLEDDQLAVTTFDLPRRRKIRSLRLRIVSRLPGRRAFQAGFSEIAVMR
ncbi:MAG: hypothetical protein VX951_00315 [Planctomycetota bacterium]|nr:hypothetical protein [Planctomycetota bacterium]